MICSSVSFQSDIACRVILEHVEGIRRTDGSDGASHSRSGAAFPDGDLPGAQAAGDLCSNIVRQLTSPCRCARKTHVVDGVPLGGQDGDEVGEGGGGGFRIDALEEGLWDQPRLLRDVPDAVWRKGIQVIIAVASTLSKFGLTAVWAIKCHVLEE